MIADNQTHSEEQIHDAENRTGTQLPEDDFNGVSAALEVFLSGGTPEQAQEAFRTIVLKVRTRQ